MHGPLESFEDSAELGLGGVPPVFADGNYRRPERRR